MLSEIALKLPEDWPRRLWQEQRVWLTVALIFVVLLGISPELAGESAGFTAGSLIETAPYLILSIGLAAYAGATGADALIARAFQGSPHMMIALAALAGGLSPFCSCGVIPLIAALLSMGVPLAAVMAFCLASPVMDPSMFVLTVGVLGTEFAIAKTMAAIGLGMFGGYVTLALRQTPALTDPLREGVGNGGCGAASVRNAKPVVWKFWHDQARRHKFITEGVKTTLFLAKWLTLAFLLESLMLKFVPAEMVASLLGHEGLSPIALATIVGVPAYLNGYAALPLIGGLIEQGMSPGAGMAFLVAGGVTCIPAAVAIFALVKRPVFILYLVLALSGSFASGLLFQGWVSL